MIGRSLLHYDIVDLLGEGGMGVVYRARDTRLDRDVAIKLLPRRIASESHELARFKVEAKAAAALNHPNVATIHAIEEVGDEMFIVMEFIEGSELQEVIAGGQLKVEYVVETAIQIADGLRAAHRKGIIHRDIKSSNIMIGTHGQVKIMDFGLAKIDGGVDLTKSGATLGTVSYMSPEQVRGEALDHRTDVWSYGVLLYEMLSGVRPFTGDYDQAILYAILNLDPKPLAALTVTSDRLSEIVGKTLEKSCDLRYQSMDRVIADLTSVRTTAASGPPKTGPDSATKELRPALAVLPFTSIRDDPEMEFLGFALADQIIGSLMYVKGLLVRPSSAVRKYQNNPADAPTAGKELHVEFILTGYYLREGDVIRLNVELVDTHSNEMVWRESIESRYENVFKLQDIASEKVLKGLNVRFSHDERARMQAGAPGDPLAYEYYLRAVSYPETTEDCRLAIKMLERSIAVDSNYAPAYAELGYRIGQVAAHAMLGIEEHLKAQDAFRKALSLNENLLTALWHLSVGYTHAGKSEDAAELIDRMFRVTPDNAMAHFALGYLYRYTGLLEESVREVETALALDPKNPRFRSAGFTYVYSGDYRKAYQVFDLDPEGTLAIAWKGMSLFLLGENQRALEYLDRAAAMEPDGYIGLRHAGISAYIRGELEEGLRLVRMLEKANPNDSDSEHWYLIANAYALLGDKAGCFRALKRAIEGGFFCYPGLIKDPMLDTVRSDEEFRRLLALSKRKHEAFKEKILGLSATPNSQVSGSEVTRAEPARDGGSGRKHGGDIA